MQGRDLQIMMFVLGLGDPTAEVARLVVVDIGQRGDAEAVGLAGGLRPSSCWRVADIAQDVAQRLGTAGITVRLHMTVEGRHEIVVDRQGDTLHWEIPSLAARAAFSMQN